jgi:hypothetical protein
MPLLQQQASFLCIVGAYSVCKLTPVDSYRCFK